MKLNKPILLFLILMFGIISCNKDYSNSSLKPHFPSSDDDYYQADSLTGHFHKPNVIREFKWKEHPAGKIVMQTNNLGLRNDNKTRLYKNHYRVIITGDSHVDGVLDNDESAAFYLEKGLNELFPTRKNEVLNAGNGYFGPQNYLGVYHKFQPYKPDLFIVAIYTGNDFLDAIRIEAENGRLNVPDRPNDYYDNLWEVDGIYSGFTGQYLNQLKFFETFPAYRDTALLITQQSLIQIKNLCKKNHSSLLVILLPTKIDTESSSDQERIDEVFEIMDFDESQLQNNRDMISSLSNWLLQNDITFIDLHEIYRQSDNELFWKADYHLNIEGHKLLASEILKTSVIYDVLSK